MPSPRKKSPVVAVLTPKKKLERWIALAGSCDKFVRNLNRSARAAGIGAIFSVDDATIYDVLMSTYYDIERFKVYHQKDPFNQKSDSVKRAAYYTKWLARLRPIQVRRPRGYKPVEADEWAFANERFAIEWAFANLSFEFGSRLPLPTEDFMFDLLYYLHFRSLADDALLQLFQIVYDTGTGTRKIFANLKAA